MKWIAAYPRFEVIDRAVGKEGFRIVLLVRLSPFFPSNALNYALGLTDIRLGHYLLASWIGLLPVTFLYVYLGSALKDLAGGAAGVPQGGTLQTVFFAAGSVMTIVTTAVVTRIARRALNTVAPAEGQSGESVPDESSAARQESRVVIGQTRSPRPRIQNCVGGARPRLKAEIVRYAKPHE